jgi:hypothetical protein
MMGEGRLVGHSPESFGEKVAVALFELLRPLPLIHNNGFRGFARLAHGVELEIGVGLNPNRARGIWAQARCWQGLARQIDREILDLAA